MPRHDAYVIHQRRGNRMSVRDILREIVEISNMEVSHEEMIPILRTMEADGIIQFNERAQTVFVRTGGVVTN